MHMQLSLCPANAPDRRHPREVNNSSLICRETWLLRPPFSSALQCAPSCGDNKMPSAPRRTTLTPPNLTTMSVNDPGAFAQPWLMRFQTSLSALASPSPALAAHFLAWPQTPSSSPSWL